MARTGVTEEQVSQAADQLLCAGERPTIERVRALLGTGSPNTLIRHLDAWWCDLGQRLAEKQRQIALPDAPAEVSEIASSLWRVALEKATGVAVSSLEQERGTLQKEREALAHERAAMAEKLSLAQLAAAEAAQALEKAEIRANGLDVVRDQQQVLIRTLEVELGRERDGSNALRSEISALSQQLEESRCQARAERDAASAHIQAVENRSHAEVDRARTETAVSVRRIAELEKKLQQLQAESAKRIETLMRARRAAEMETASFKLKLASAGKPKPHRKPPAGKRGASSSSRAAKKSPGSSPTRSKT